MVKLSVLPWGKDTGARGRLTILYSLWWTTRAVWGPSAIIWAMPTPDLHSLGSARFVVLRPTSGVRTQA
jgi:hypothetical protein